MFYSFVVALLSGLIAGTAATKLFGSKWSYAIAIVVAAIVAVVLNVGVLQTMASFFPTLRVMQQRAPLPLVVHSGSR